MTRFLLLPFLALTLTACRTESTDAATDDAPVEDGMTASPNSLEADPLRAEDAEATTRTATLKDVTGGDGDCFVMLETSEGDNLLMGTAEACAQGEALKGRVVTITEEAATLPVQLGEETVEQPMQLVVGIEPVQE